MKTSHHSWLQAGALALGLALVGPSHVAKAEESPAPSHRFTVYTTAGAQAYLSSARTMGGVGGGLGLRDTINGRFILQADLSYLSMLGNTGSLRIGAGVQRSGMWAPAALLTVTTLFGEHLSFLTPEHPERLTSPAVSLGVTLAPVRFELESVQVSVLQLGIGAGTDLPGLGLNFSLGLLEAGVTF
ncbi:hypothetical protein [Archangium lansingense]|uniref:Outer membrane protein beta-barrel domain-containing protein n=1 Tax=Archangium lansingense TaxID=2995310 RepID=A0ABT4A9Y0_9BACT|nr:hypothetical protein [Archangium lansinium]MCY1078386.1 hypothetical protein [Archangium lansinium]